jgi:hypothetical protein
MDERCDAILCKGYKEHLFLCRQQRMVEFDEMENGQDVQNHSRYKHHRIFGCPCIQNNNNALLPGSFSLYMKKIK